MVVSIKCLIEWGWSMRKLRCTFILSIEVTQNEKNISFPLEQLFYRHFVDFLLNDFCMSFDLIDKKDSWTFLNKNWTFSELTLHMGKLPFQLFEKLSFIAPETYTHTLVHIFIFTTHIQNVNSFMNNFQIFSGKYRGRFIKVYCWLRIGLFSYLMEEVFTRVGSRASFHRIMWKNYFLNNLSSSKWIANIASFYPA